MPDFENVLNEDVPALDTSESQSVLDEEIEPFDPSQYQSILEEDVPALSTPEVQGALGITPPALEDTAAFQQAQAAPVETAAVSQLQAAGIPETVESMTVPQKLQLAQRDTKRQELEILAKDPEFVKRAGIPGTMENMYTFGLMKELAEFKNLPEISVEELTQESIGDVFSALALAPLHGVAQVAKSAIGAEALVAQVGGMETHARLLELTARAIGGAEAKILGGSLEENRPKQAIGAFVFDALNTAPQLITSMIANFAGQRIGGPVGGRVGMIASAFMQEGGAIYLDLVESGTTPDRAKWVSMGVGIINAGLESVGVEKIMRRWMPRGLSADAKRSIARQLAQDGVFETAIREFLSTGSTEAWTEMLQEAVTIVGERVARDQPIVREHFEGFSEDLYRSLYAGALGLTVGGVTGVAGSGLSAVSEGKTRRKRLAEVLEERGRELRERVAVEPRQEGVFLTQEEAEADLNKTTPPDDVLDWRILSKQADNAPMPRIRNAEEASIFGRNAAPAQVRLMEERVAAATEAEAEIAQGAPDWTNDQVNEKVDAIVAARIDAQAIRANQQMRALVKLGENQRVLRAMSAPEFDQYYTSVINNQKVQDPVTALTTGEAVTLSVPQKVLTAEQMRYELADQGMDTDLLVRMNDQQIEATYLGEVDPTVGQEFAQLQQERATQKARAAQAQEAVAAVPIEPDFDPAMAKVIVAAGGVNYGGTEQIEIEGQTRQASTFVDPLTGTQLVVYGEPNKGAVLNAVADNRVKKHRTTEALRAAGMTPEVLSTVTPAAAQRYLTQHMPVGDEVAVQNAKRTLDELEEFRAGRGFARAFKEVGRRIDIVAGQQLNSNPMFAFDVLMPLFSEAKAQAQEALRKGTITVAEYSANVIDNLTRMVGNIPGLADTAEKIREWAKKQNLKPKGQNFRGIHIGPLNSNYKVLSGRFRKDKHTYVNGVWMYMQDAKRRPQVEPRFKGGKLYEVNLANVLLFDIGSQAGQALSQKHTSPGALVKKIKSLGYDGYYNSAGGRVMNKAVFVFGDIKLDPKPSLSEATKNVSDIIVENVYTTGGGTIDPRTGRFVEVSDFEGEQNAMVSMGADLGVTLDGVTVGEGGRPNVDPEQVSAAASAVMKKSGDFLLNNDDYFLGYWWDGDLEPGNKVTLHIDISRRTDPDTAVRVGEVLDQKSVVTNMRDLLSDKWENVFTATYGEDKARSLPPLSERWEWASAQSTHLLPVNRAGFISDAVDMLGVLSPGEKRKNAQIAKMLIDFVAKGPGAIPTDAPTGVKVRRMVESLLSEFHLATPEAQAGKTWYSQDIDETTEILTRFYPELKDPMKKKLFWLQAAITSPVSEVSGNLVAAMRSWDYYRQHGRFPSFLPDLTVERLLGVNPTGVAAAGARLNAIVARFGEQGAIDWLMAEHPVAELREFTTSLNDVWQTGKALGAEIFGPKVGAFATNMAGLKDPITIDRWVLRTFGAYMGQLYRVKADGTVIENDVMDAPTNEQRRIIRTAFNEAANKLGLDPRDLQAVMWNNEQQVWKALGADTKSWRFPDAARNIIERLEGGETLEQLEDEFVSEGIETTEEGEVSDPAEARRRARAGEGKIRLPYLKRTPSQRTLIQNARSIEAVHTAVGKMKDVAVDEQAGDIQNGEALVKAAKGLVGPEIFDVYLLRAAERTETAAEIRPIYRKKAYKREKVYKLDNKGLGKTVFGYRFAQEILDAFDPEIVEFISDVPVSTQPQIEKSINMDAGEGIPIVYVTKRKDAYIGEMNESHEDLANRAIPGRADAAQVEPVHGKSFVRIRMTPRRNLVYVMLEKADMYNSRAVDAIFELHAGNEIPRDATVYFVGQTPGQGLKVNEYLYKASDYGPSLSMALLPGSTQMAKFASNMVSAVGAQSTQDLRRALGIVAGDVASGSRKVMLRLMRSTGLAQVSPKYQEVWRGLGMAERHVTRIEHQIKGELTDFRKAYSQNERDTVVKVIWQGNQEEAVYTPRELSQGVQVGNIKIKLTGREIELYTRMRNVVAMGLDMRLEEILYRQDEAIAEVEDRWWREFNRGPVQIIDPTTKKLMRTDWPGAKGADVLWAHIQSLKEERRQIVNHYQSLKDRGYVSLKRRGRYVVTALDPNLDAEDPQAIIYAQAESALDAAKTISKFERAGYANIQNHKKELPNYELLRKFSLDDVETLLMSHGINLWTSDNPVVSKLASEFAQKSRMKSYQIRRKFIRGFGENYNDYVTSVTMQAETYASANMRTIGGSQARKALNVSGLKESDKQMFDVAASMIEDHVNPPKTGMLGFVGVKTRQLTYFMQLGGEVGQLFLNAFGQPISITYPFFARPEFKMGIGEPEKYFVRAMGLASKVMLGRGPTELQGMHNRAREEGVVTAEFAKALLEDERGKVTKTMHYLSIFQQTGEYLTRSQALTEAYLVGTEKLDISGEELYQFMVSSVKFTQGDFGNAQNPYIIRRTGEIGRAFYQFQSYGQLWAEAFAASLASEIRAGRWSLPAVRRQLMAIGGLGGITGLPGWYVFRWVYFWLFGDDPVKELKKEAKKRDLGELVYNMAMYGVTGEPGVSTRIGIFNHDMGLDSREYNIMDQMPSYTTVRQMYRGINDLSHGDYLRAAEGLAPRFIRGPLKAHRYATQGLRRRNQAFPDISKRKFDASDILLQAINVTPGIVIEHYDKKRFKKTLR